MTTNRRLKGRLSVYKDRLVGENIKMAGGEGETRQMKQLRI